MKKIFVQFLNDIQFKIVFQTHIESEFNELSENGFFISSNGYPEVVEGGLYVLGKDEGWEQTVLRTRDDKWKKRMIKAIKKYNEINK